MTARVWCREERSEEQRRARGGRSLYGSFRVAMKVDVDARDMPAAPTAQPGTPIASNTESPVPSLDGLLS